MGGQWWMFLEGNQASRPLEKCWMYWGVLSEECLVGRWSQDTLHDLKAGVWLLWNEAFLRPGGASGEELTCQCRRHERRRFDPWVGKIPWRRAWWPTPVFLPGKIAWTEEPGRLQSMGSQGVGHDWVTFTHFNSSGHSQCYAILTMIHLPNFSPS